MPTVTLNKEVFEKLVGKKLELEQLKDRISMIGTDLESVEGNEIKVEVFPNRPDMLSEQGFARAFSSFIGVKTGLRKYDVKKSGDKVIIKDLPKQWPYAVACIVKGLKLDSEKVREIIQLQEKLGTTLTRNRKKGGLGLYPLDKIKFPVTFKGMIHSEVNFAPLGFTKVMDANTIIKEHPKSKEYGHIMNGWEKCPVFVDANNNIMSMPPLINSNDLGKIEEFTKDVFIEGTGPDLETIRSSLNILVTSLADMGGQIYSLEMNYEDSKKDKFDFPDLSPKKMKIDLEYVNKRLGLTLSEKEMKELLLKMGYGYENNNVLVPAYRADVMHQVDFVEDIAIAYGYENFVPEIPNVMTIASENEFEKFVDKVSSVLIGLGLIETYTNTLTSKNKQLSLMNYEGEVIELSNSVSSEHDCVRSWLIPSLMEVLQNNRHHELPHRLFDVGIVCEHDTRENQGFSGPRNADISRESGNSQTGVKESTHLSLVIAQDDADYTKARQVLEYLFSSIGVRGEFKKFIHSSFIPGRVASVSVNIKERDNNIKKTVAFIGEIHPSVLNNWGLEVPVCAFELNLSELFEVVKND